MKWSATVHESFHKDLLLDRFATVDRLDLLLFFDKLSIVQVNLGAHLDQGLDSGKVTLLNRREKGCLSIIIDHVDFGSETTIFAALRLR